jgi:hypothetical protein
MNNDRIQRLMPSNILRGFLNDNRIGLRISVKYTSTHFWCKTIYKTPLIEKKSDSLDNIYIWAHRWMEVINYLLKFLAAR